MKKFTSISRPEAIEIYQDIIKNYKRLKKTAEFGQTEANYGVALSLYILSSEELIKAFVVLMHGFGVNVFQIKELNKVFHHHKTKHELSTLMELLVLVEAFFTATDKNTYSASINTGIKFIDETYKFLRGIQKAAKPLLEIEENLNWWSKADDYKNRGLYVDYRDELKTPNQITKEECESGKEKAEKLYERIRVVKITFEHQSTEEQKQIISDANKGITTYLKEQSNN